MEEGGGENGGGAEGAEGGGLIVLRIRKVTSWRLGSICLIIYLICVWKLGA